MVSLQVNYTLFDAQFVPSSARLVALGNYARGTGAIEICAIEDGKIVVKKSHEKPAAFKCGTFRASSIEERSLATGDFKGVRVSPRPEAPKRLRCRDMGITYHCPLRITNWTL